MSDLNDEESLGSEVSNRLDALFGDEDAAETPGGKPLPEGEPGVQNAARPPEKESKAGLQHGGPAEDSPLKNLKALVFSIDWEITDETMVAFLEEIKRLEKRYKDDKVFSLFLKLHDSVGRYIKARKARAHPDSMKFIASVFKSFERAVLTPGMTEMQKKKLLSAEVKKFKAFKQRIRVMEEAAAPAEEAAYEEIRIEKAAAPVLEKALEKPAIPLESQAALDYLVAEIRKMIRAEFQTLLQIIKNLGA